MTQEYQKFTKAKPKQDFTINHSIIMNSRWLKMPIRVWLYIILERHKVFNRNEYQYIPNQVLSDTLGISIPTLIKQRDELERLKLVEVMSKVNGKLTSIDRAHRKNQPLYYHPNFISLLKYKFIEPIEMSQHQKDFREATRKPTDKMPYKSLKIGDVLTHINSKALNSNKNYNIIFKSIDNDKTAKMVCVGHMLKNSLREEHDNNENCNYQTIFNGESK